MKKKTILLFLILYTALFVQAQQNQIKFEHYTINEGLSNNCINTIHRDHLGLLWIGTNNGINVFDGYNFKTYNHQDPDSNSISDNIITKIFQDSDNDIWVGTRNGELNLFVPEKENFKRIKLLKEHRLIRAIIEFNNKILVGSKRGLFTYDKKTKKINDHPFQKINNIPNFGVTSFAKDKDGDLWIGTNTKFIIHINSKTNQTEFLQLTNSLQSPDPKFYRKTLFIDSDNELWIGSTGNGAWKYNIATKKLQYFKQDTNNHKTINHNLIEDFCEIERGKIWVGTDNMGINIYDKKTRTFSHLLASDNPQEKHRLNSNGIYCFHRDQQNIIWVGTFDNGLNMYTRNRYQFEHLYRSSTKKGNLPHNNITSMAQASNDKVWIGTDGGGFSLFDPKEHSFTPFTKTKGENTAMNDLHTTALYQDSEGWLYIAAFNKGFSKINLKTREEQDYPLLLNKQNKKTINEIYCFFEDSRGNFWIGTRKGLVLYDRKAETFKFYTHSSTNKKSISNNLIRNITEDSQRKLWIGTFNGLSVYNYKQDNFSNYYHQSKKNSLSNNLINSITESSDKKIWIGTDGGGLNCFDPLTKEFHALTQKDGLTCNIIYDIEKDKNNLWISTACGLMKLSSNPLNIKVYDKNDGIQSKQFSRTASLKTTNGELIFGGVNGLNIFHPDSISIKNNSPKILFTNFNINNQPASSSNYGSKNNKNISIESEIILHPDDHVFSLEFTALDFINPKKIKYEYQLQGFDKKWTKTNYKRRFITYSNLPGDTYTLLVRSTNSDEIWQNNINQIKVTIIPPFYKTPLFIIFTILLVIGLFVASYFRKIKLIQKQKTILQHTVDERTKELKERSTVTHLQTQEILHQNHELEIHRHELEKLVNIRTHDLLIAKNRAETADKLKSSFLANMSHEIRTPMNAIVGFISILERDNFEADERKEYMDLIKQSSFSLIQLIDDIIDISRIESGELQITNKKFNLRKMMTELYKIHSSEADLTNKRIKVELELPEQDIFIVSDEKRIRQILSNLLENAIKFTEEGRIFFRAILDNNNVFFQVEDTGIGIKYEHQDLIFKRFTKIEDSETRLYAGTGLGLAISKELTERLQGELWVNSTYKKGSIFNLKIQIDTTPKPATQQTQQKRTSYYKWAGKTILVAEDEQTNFQLIESILKETEARILRAETGVEVMDIYKNESIDIILMDIKMPVMDGDEALSHIRKQDKEIPVIAQTAYAMKEDPHKFKAKGFNEYLSKPIDVELLLASIDKYLS